MKKIKIEQKLSLNKKKITTLNSIEMSNAKGMGTIPLQSAPNGGCVFTLDVGYCAHTVHPTCNSGGLFC